MDKFDIITQTTNNNCDVQLGIDTGWNPLSNTINLSEIFEDFFNTNLCNNTLQKSDRTNISTTFNNKYIFSNNPIGSRTKLCKFGSHCRYGKKCWFYHPTYTKLTHKDISL
jgi:hypothetical protein